MEQITLNLEETTQEIKEKLNQTAENFVYVGYRLRQITDSGAFGEAGYTNIYDYAKKELSLSVTAVSRFMAINKKYSEGGYGPKLRKEYQGYGFSKLAEMITLKEEDCAVLEPETPVKQIREYKNFVKNEPQNDGQESFIQENEPEEDAKLKELLKEYFRGNMDLLRKVISGECDAEILQEQMNPDGVGNLKSGMVFLMMKDMEHGVVYREFGKPPVTMTWEELLVSVKKLLTPEYDALETEEKERIAKEKERKKEEREREQKKERKEPVATSQIKDTEKEQRDVEPEEQIPGQMEVEDYPEILPEKEPETGENTLTEENVALEEVKEEDIPEYAEETEKSGDKNEESTVKKLDLTMTASEVYGLVQKMDYEAAVEKCEKLLILLKRKVHEDGKEQKDESNDI